MVKSSDSSQNGSSQKEHAQTIKDAFEHLRGFSSSTSFKGALCILDELASLRSQLADKEKELLQAKEETKKNEDSHSTAISEMLKANVKEIGKKEELQAKIDAMEAAAKEKDALLKEKETEMGKLDGEIQTLKKSVGTGTEKLTKANNEITELQKKLKDRDILNDKNAKKETELKKTLAARSTEVQKLEEKLSSVESSFRTSEGELQKLKGLFAELTEEDELAVTDQFEELWEFANKGIWSLLKDDLPNNILQNATAWKHFRSEAEEIIPEEWRIALPTTNTPGAKGMRLAVVLAMLARQIDSRIFQLTYFDPPNEHEDNEERNFREFSAAKLALYDEEREAYCRSLLSLIRPEMQAQRRNERVQEVVKKVSSTFELILPDAKKAGMNDVVKNIVNKAADLWRRLQRAKVRYETDFEPSIYDDLEYMDFEIPNSTPAGDQATNSVFGITLLTVIPRLSKISKEGRHGLTYVHQIRSSTPLCVEAKKEVTKEPQTPVDRRRFHGTRRRESLAVNGVSQQNGTGHANANGNGAFLDKSKSG